MAVQPGALIIDDPCEEYDFVDRLPDEYTCSVCLDVLREPHLTTCCGRHFCKRCIERVLNRGKPCPLCKQPGFVAVIDKSVERRILAMKVRCPFRALGCDWVGEMRRQPDHLDLERGQCEHRHIKCPNGCGMLVPKAELESHLADSCSKRKPFCEYCYQYYGDIEEHNRTCPDYPVRCPNECSDSCIPRSSLAQHLPQCPCRPVPCEFQCTAGTAKVRQNEMAHHLETTSQAHLGQVSLVLMHGLREKDDQTAELQRQLREKDQEIAQLRDTLRKLQVDFEGQLQVQRDLIRSRLRESNGQLETLEDRYCGRQFYQCSRSDWTVHFVVVKNLRAHLEVDRSEVDSYTSGTVLQGFELKLRWTQPDRPPESFNHALKLHGAKGEIHFNLCIDPEVVAGRSRDASTTSNQLHPPLSGISLYKYPRGLQSEPEMKDLTNEVVAEIPDLWQEVGIQLHVPYNDMLGYHERNPTAKRMFTYVLATWRNCRTSEYSWANLIKALRSPSVNQLRLAHELTKKLTAPLHS